MFEPSRTPAGRQDDYPDVTIDVGFIDLVTRTIVLAPEGLQPRRQILNTMDLVAGEGRPHGGSNRPFGFEEDKVTIRESEAGVIRKIVDRFVGGESLRSIAIWLEESGVKTVRGRPWKTPTIAAVLMSGRIAGLREHHGVVVSKAVWPPIISEVEREAVLAVFARRKLPTGAVRQRYLLTGLLRCGKCGNALYSSARPNGRRYVCMSGPDHGGCGKLAVVAEPIETVLTEQAFQRLHSFGPIAQRAIHQSLAGVASVRDEWADLLLATRHQFLHLLFEHAVVEPGRAGTAFNPNRVRPVWRTALEQTALVDLIAP